LEADEYFLVDNQDLEVGIPAEDRHLQVEDMPLRVAVDMRHLVLVVVGMRYFAVDRLVHPMDSHLLVDRSADILNHRTVDTVQALGWGNLVLDLDIPKQVGIDQLDLDTAQSLVDTPVQVDR